MERLCFNCWFHGLKECDFAKIAQEIADNPNLSPQEKHQRISDARSNAREKGCPRINEVDPYYEGRENL